MLQAGQETSTNCLGFTFYLMAKHPDVVENMYNEAVSVCGPTGPISWEQVHELKCVCC